MRIIVTTIIAASLAFVSASEAHQWRLSERAVMRIAERAVTAAHFDLARLPEREVQRHPKTDEWFVSFAPRSPSPPDSDVLVVVSDKTGRAKVSYGA